ACISSRSRAAGTARGPSASGRMAQGTGVVVGDGGIGSNSLWQIIPRRLNQLVRRDSRYDDMPPRTMLFLGSRFNECLLVQADANYSFLVNGDQLAGMLLNLGSLPRPVKIVRHLLFEFVHLAEFHESLLPEEL